MSESETPLLDQLKGGPWPSFVDEIDLAAETNDMAKDLKKQLELSYEDKVMHWKHSGLVGVRGYGGGIVGRYSEFPDKFPAIAAFHTLRVNHPAGWFYTSEVLHKLCDVWDEYGSSLTNMHGSTGDILLLGATTENLQPCFDELTELGFDLGGSGSGVRTPGCCVGMARCEWACIDTMAITYRVTQHFQDELHRPMFPYKFKVKVAGCANDCIAAIARADMSIIGTWRDTIQVDQDAVQEHYAGNGMDIRGEVCDLCPTGCINWDEGAQTLTINDAECSRCMHCINRMPKALRPGKEKGATILLGSKAPIVHGALMSWVIVPFMKLEEPYDELLELIEKIIDWWDERGKNRERIGELLQRVGMRQFLRDTGLPPAPQMVYRPRANPYIFWWPEEVK